MNNNLEDFIRENRNNFNLEDPPDSHMNRFGSKLNIFNSQYNKTRNLFVLKIAASFSIIITISITILWIYINYYYQAPNPITSMATIEFNETKEYYANQINFRIEQLKKIKDIESDQKNFIFAELDTMTCNYMQLQEELKNNPLDERVMNAIIGHYQVKLDALNQIIQSFTMSYTNSKNGLYENSL